MLLPPTFTTTIPYPGLHDIGSLRRFPLPLDTTEQQDFLDRGGVDATISPHFKYCLISVGAILDIDGYLGMSIPIIKQGNLSGYGRIPMRISWRSEKSMPPVTTLQNIYTLRNL